MIDNRKPTTQVSTMIILLSFYKLSYPFPHHSITHCFVNLNLTICFSQIYVPCIKKPNYRSNLICLNLIVGGMGSAIFLKILNVYRQQNGLTVNNINMESVLAEGSMRLAPMHRILTAALYQR